MAGLIPPYSDLPKVTTRAGLPPPWSDEELSACCHETRRNCDQCAVAFPGQACFCFDLLGFIGVEALFSKTKLNSPGGENLPAIFLVNLARVTD